MRTRPTVTVSTAPARLYIGTAGWSIPRASAHRAAGDGTHLERYARVFGAVEINSSFHGPHPAATYARWREMTPAEFRFAVKVPRTITHDQQLRRARLPFAEFLAQTNGLGAKRGPLLVQLPPSLEFEARVASTFFEMARTLYDGPLVCEPRHPTWFAPRATVLLERHRIARVAADPPPAPEANRPDGWPGVVYFRLHGSPRKYWSSYSADFLAALAVAVRERVAATHVWCLFDNTASGAALENAWELQRLLTAPTSAHFDRGRRARTT
jgi:uncharacterized protein YecE (DUF72 family)